MFNKEQLGVATDIKVRVTLTAADFVLHLLFFFGSILIRQEIKFIYGSPKESNPPTRVTHT